MKIENKIALAFVALMFIMGISTNANRASRHVESNSRRQ